MDYLPDHSGRPIRIFDVIVALVLGGVVFAQIEIWRSMKPVSEIPAPSVMTGPLAAVPAQAVATPARVYIGKPKVVHRARVAKRSHAMALVISSRPRLAAHRAKHRPAKKVQARGFSPKRYELPRDEFVAPLPELEG